MSRTVRRKNYIPKWVTHKNTRVGTGFLAWTYEFDSVTGEYTGRKVASRWEAHTYVQVPLEGNELKKSLARHHGDHGHATGCNCGYGPGKWFRQNEQQSYRAKCKIELSKYLHNSEHEVMILANPKLPYWD